MHDVQNQGLERRGRVEFLKLQKDYSFTKYYYGFQNQKVCCIQHFMVLQNLCVSQNHEFFLKLQKYFASKQGLNCKPGNTNVLVLQLSICQHMHTYVNSNITDT